MNQPGKPSTTETQRHGEIHSKEPDSSNIFFGFNRTTFGYAGLITQHYPTAGKRSATFNLVLETE